MKQKKVEENKRYKENEYLKEGKKMKKKENEAKRLEMLEAEILKRLKDTHLR